MKLWQRKKVWIRNQTKRLCNKYLWHAFFPVTTEKICRIAWHLKDQRNFEQDKFHWLGGKYYKDDSALYSYIEERSLLDG